MNFQRTKIPGVVLIEPALLQDERGFFARTWCEESMAQEGLNTCQKQCNVSFNHKRGTLRGMHLQLAPHEECKIVRCTRGQIFDVVVDLRPQSFTYMQWQAFDLNSENHHLLYIPAGIAHGFQTLSDNAEVFYHMSESYFPAASVGYRWDDPVFNIEWPLEVACISAKDANFPLIQQKFWRNAA